MGQLEGRSTWKKVLNFLYTKATKGEYFQGTAKIGWSDPEHPITKSLNLKGNELFSSLLFLNEQGLIESISITTPEPTPLKLTTKGFDVALRNEELIKQDKIIETQNTINSTVAIFTVVLALATLWPILRNLETIQSNVKTLLDWGFIISIIIIMATWVGFIFTRK